MTKTSTYPDYPVAQGTVSNIVLYYVLVFGLAWLIWIPLALASWSLLPFQLPGTVAWLAAMAPIFAGTFMLTREYGRNGLKQLLLRCRMWRFNIEWYLLAFGLPVFLILLDLGIYRLIGGTMTGQPIAHWIPAYLSSLLPIIPLSIFEESAWRGYASPRLQSILEQLGGSLVLGILWGLWHIPFYLIRGVSFFADFDFSHLATALFFFVIGTAAFETTMKWLFRHVRGSLIFACIFHASNNAFAGLTFLPTAQAEQGQIFI